MASKKKSISKSGFSLVELLVILGIIGVLFTVLTPGILSSLPDYRLRSATRDIISIIQEARLRAVKENANTAISLDFANDSYIAWVDNGTGAGAGNGSYEPGLGETLFIQVNLPTGIDLYSNSSGSNIANPFDYNSRGFPASGNGSIYLKNDKSNYRRIIMNVSGNIRVVKSSDGTTWN